MRRQILRLFLERLELIDQQREALAQSAESMREHQEAVTRLGQTAGLGADSAQQIIAEVGPQAATFDSAGQLASWVGCCPGREESAAVSHSDRSPKGNCVMRRILNQAANAAIKAKGSILQICTVGWYPDSGTRKLSGPWLISSAEWCGRSCTMV